MSEKHNASVFLGDCPQHPYQKDTANTKKCEVQRGKDI